MEQRPRSVSELGAGELTLEPKLFGREDAFRDFCHCFARKLGADSGNGSQQAIDAARDELRLQFPGPAQRPDVALRFACSIVIDLVAQGWNLEVRGNKVRVRKPGVDGETREATKSRVRAGHLHERNAQLRAPPVAAFVKSMEERRLGPAGWVSIFSLMRDGRDLEKKLSAVRREPSEARRSEILRTVISPYIQVVEPDAVCSTTGLKLMDIWRYFRHTWVSTYKSLPGRSMMILVRDAANPFHPVIGIAALGSSMAQQKLRDEWIGWDSDTFIKKLTEKPTASWCDWIHHSIERLLNSIYQQDFFKENVIEAGELNNPTDRTITRLLKKAAQATETHRLFPSAADHKNNANGEVDWTKQARTPLFRAKRARTLAMLLNIRMSLQGAGFAKNSPLTLRTALASSKAKNAIRQLVRLVKAEHVGVDMMDITICGAIAPYNLLLGGKLVCLMLASPEVVRCYRVRYGKQASIIASSMKGASVMRSPNLVLLATTSLYGVGSSQYNRVRVPLDKIGGENGGNLEYIELGTSKGFGSYHFSAASLDCLEALIPRGRENRKVNSIFGEGVNPLMRKVRDALAVVALPANELLNHGNPRVVYGIPIAKNFREVLVGLDHQPKYYLSLKNARKTTSMLVDYWRQRWLARRIMRPGLLEEVAKQTLSYPIAHGARVVMPANEETYLFGPAAS
jgi:hypothetical protein